MSVMMARTLAKRTAERQSTDDLVDTITEVLTELFPELLITALADPTVRVELHRALARNQRTTPPQRSAAEVKAARRRG